MSVKSIGANHVELMLVSKAIAVFFDITVFLFLKPKPVLRIPFNWFLITFVVSYTDKLSVLPLRFKPPVNSSCAKVGTGIIATAKL